MSKTTKKSNQSAQQVCSSCNAKSSPSAKDCEKCGKSRFEPSWVLEKRNINRQFSVQITKSNPNFGESIKRITLSKWWPGGRATLHIPSESQWQKISGIINDDLANIVGWKKVREIINKISANGKQNRKQKADLKRAVGAQPEILQTILESIDIQELGKRDFDSLVETLVGISDVVTNANAGFREAFLGIVKQLPKQKQRALEDLSLLLKNWSLHVVTNVAQQVKSRIETIELFEQQINDDRTYEIMGDNSIHRILENAMWLVDERYWLLHSNKTLLKQIGKAMEKKDKNKFGNKRPDFVCGTVGEKLIILELKRPKHTLTVKDLNQLETYVLMADKYFTFRSVEAYLVGQKIDPDLKQTLKFRKDSFKILTYTDLIGKTKERYRDYLNEIDK
ncbi:MAG: hypothetical protein R2681_17530 [Pyrinomonadaceae bacterium]